MSRLVLPIMKKQGKGVIVNNGSDWSVVAGRDAFPYIMSKGAVAMMTKAMALDYAAREYPRQCGVPRRHAGGPLDGKGLFRKLGSGHRR